MTLKVLVVLDVADPATPVDPVLLDGLVALGYAVQTAHGGDTRLTEQVVAFGPDVIIIDSESDARDALEHVAMATRDAPRPIALFTDYDDTSHVPELLRRGVSAYVVAGLHPSRLKPVLEVAVARFELDQQLRAELADTRSQLEDRKLLDRAKAILMKQGLDEDEAHRRMRRMAMERNLKLVEVARRVIDMAQLLG